MRSSMLVLLLSALLLSCSGEESGERNASTNQTEASTPADDISRVRKSVSTEEPHEPANDAEPVPEIQFEREQSFGSSDEVIVGSIATFTVGDSNRVYIADQDQTTIHVYNPDGSYNTSLGQQGKGPGEFTVISPWATTMEIHSKRLYVTDVVDIYRHFPHRVHVFLLNDLSFSHTMKILAENKNDFNKLEKYSPSRMYPISEGMFLVAYRRSPNEYQDSLSFIRYVIQDSTGNIVSEPIFEQKDRTNLVYNYPTGATIIHSFPFHGKSLLDVSEDGHLYAARTEEFKVDVYDMSGEQIRTFEHPFDNKAFSKSKVLERYEKTDYMPELGDGVALKMIREADNLPEKWPTLETMFFDDEDRLWVATIVDDLDVYEWWVLDASDGSLLARFTWPRDKAIEEIKNGKLYTRETEEETGLEEIIRYDIEIRES